MIQLELVVQVVFYLLIAAGVFGLLWLAINLVGGLFQGEAADLFIRVARVVLAILAILILIGLLLSLSTHQPLFRWGHS